MTKAIIESAMAISELAYVLENISYSDKKKIEDYTDAEILHEAKYVLGLFIDPYESHFNAEDFRGENGEAQQKWAEAEVRKLKAFIKKYSAKKAPVQFKHNAPVNPMFLGAQRARNGQDY
jgi:hypothetical protein